jgi:hypothetical protein
VAGHLSGVTRNWSNLPGQLGSSLRLRRQTRYALLLDRWFVMEAEKLGSLDEIWHEYQFVVKKLGFSRVELVISGQRYTWDLSSGIATTDDRSLHMVHQLGTETTIEFFADKDTLSETSFLLLGDLAAETWYKTHDYQQKFPKSLAHSVDPTPPANPSSREQKDSRMLGVPEI